MKGGRGGGGGGGIEEKGRGERIEYRSIEGEGGNRTGVEIELNYLLLFE